MNQSTTAVISEILTVAAGHAEKNWDGEGAEPVSAVAVDRAVAFVRALPAGVLPEVAAEPDGAISLDWMQSRTRVLSISVGLGERLALAWIDGEDQGHAVAVFDGERIPPRVLAGIRGMGARSYSEFMEFL